ncbi:MAG: Flavin-dependent thymidylate synthase [Syntrophus sp. SKADARSKE-3]|nr:Flavin-dependent thymidylate synthase [Syntrophus sp. SKADARSKE-3]
MKGILLKGSPEEIAVAGALGCTDEDGRSSADILHELQLMEDGKAIDKYGKVLAGSFGRGHGSVGDQANFQFSLEGVSRLVTLFLCQSTHASFLQQSLRRVKAGGYVLPDSLKDKPYAKDVIGKAFDLYQKMVAAGVPAEDARYILPLLTTTNIQVNVNARELCHLAVMAKSQNVPYDVRYAVMGMFDETICSGGVRNILTNHGANYEPLSFYPAPDLFAENGPLDDYEGWKCLNGIDVMLQSSDVMSNVVTPGLSIIDPSGLSALKHYHFTFIAGMSLAALHQAIRQRTWDHCVETLANAAFWSRKNWLNRIIVPPSVPEHNYAQAFALQHVAMLDAYEHALEDGVPKSEAFGLIPHSLKIFDLFHVNGWNAIHSIGKRICSKAQWEIRRIAWEAARQIDEVMPSLGKYAKPQCVTMVRCPEKDPCGKNNKKQESIANCC